VHAVGLAAMEVEEVHGSRCRLRHGLGQREIEGGGDLGEGDLIEGGHGLGAQDQDGREGRDYKVASPHVHARVGGIASQREAG
jgi:hypothetical protein